MYVYGLKVKEKPKEQIQIDGEVLDEDIRKVSSHGDSLHTSIPKDRLSFQPGWKRFLTATMVIVKLVRDSDGELIMIITRPKKLDIPKKEDAP